MRSDIALQVLFAAAALGGMSSAQVTERVSVNSWGEQGNDANYGASVSAHGRRVAFVGNSSNFVRTDTGIASQVWVHDRPSGRTFRVSESSAGAAGNLGSESAVLSANGGHVAFCSQASNLVPGDTHANWDVFVHDCDSRTTSLVSLDSAGVYANGDSRDPALSADGRFVAFSSAATNLVPGDTNQVLDAFVRDTLMGTTTRVSVGPGGAQGNGLSHHVAISGDGRFVGFCSAAGNLVPGDTNGTLDVFVHDRQTATTSRVSVGSQSVQGNNESDGPALSADGRYVVFSSFASNLVPADTNDHSDVFLRDVLAGTTRRVSVSSTGAQANYSSLGAVLSADGLRIAFTSYATDLVPGDANGREDAFLRDEQAGTTLLVGVNSSGAQANWSSSAAGISADGRFVGFQSFASNLVPRDTNGRIDVFVRDLLGCSPTIASYCMAGTTSHGCRPTIAGLGTPSASAGAGFVLRVDDVEGQREGVIFYSLAGAQQTPFGNGRNFMCLQPPLVRTIAQLSGGTMASCDGYLALDWNQLIAAQPPSVPFVGGETVWAQGWCFDPLAPGGAGLSDALWFGVCR